MVERPINEYLRFEEFTSPSGKTLTVHVLSARSGDALGSIGWYGPWRQYTFRPSPNTIWNTGCLDTVQAYIAALMAERNAARNGGDDLLSDLTESRQQGKTGGEG